MNCNTFYGNNKYVRDLPDENESDDPDLSDDEDYQSEARILAFETDSEGENEDTPKDTVEVIVSETDFESNSSAYGELSSSDDSDDNIPLDALAEKLYPNTWRSGNLMMNPDEIKFKGEQNLPSELTELESPLDFFRFFFTKEILCRITHQTNLYSVQKHPDRSANISTNEIEQFIGMCLYMSLIQLPQARHYWSSELGHPAISCVMSCNRWEQIKRFLHFNNNDDFIPKGNPGHDKLFKIRPLLQDLQNRLYLIPLEEHIAVDEQIIPTKARSSLKQYNAKKPHKWGYKVFVLSGISGFSYDFDIFAGAQSNIVPPGAPDLGVSSNVVVKLAKIIPRHKNHKIFFDNWFTSIPLEVYLAKEGILPLGTARLNRVTGCVMPSEKDMKKAGRGTMKEKIIRKDNVTLSSVSWYDNKTVTTLSTYVGSKPTGLKKRFFKSESCHKMIPCPQSILKYNEYMGGVDLLDSMLGYYRIKLRSRRWYLRIFFHLIDMFVVNSWLLWRRQNDEYMPLADFKIAIADGLCKAGKSTLSRKRGRPSGDVEAAYERKKKRGAAAPIPQRDIRKDGIDHLPEWRENERNRCKYPDCKFQAFTYCIKCHVPLCLNKDRNCFLRFHSE